VGESFEGVISGVTEFGLFITLEKFLVSGLLHVADLKRDRYQLSKDQTYLYGIKSGRRYRFGDSINIKIVAVSPFEGKMTLLQNEHKRRRKT
jgi:ribonuclease R